MVALLVMATATATHAAQLGEIIGLLGEPRDSIGPVGYSVCMTADVGGDGQPDILVGAPDWTSPGDVTPGRAHLYAGGAFLDTLPDVTFQGQLDGDEFGFAVAGGFDLNAAGGGEANH